MKYFKTYHLPFSPGKLKYDKVLNSIYHLLKKNLIFTEKLDGSNICLCKEGVFSRSHAQFAKHHSFDMLKKIYNNIKNNIPENYLFYGEWLYAVHSIKYDKLPNYLFLFAIYDKNKKVWKNWDFVKEYSYKLNIPTVPFLGEICCFSVYELENVINLLMKNGSKYGNEIEGIIIRTNVDFIDPNINVAKYVRENHTQTNKNWLFKKTERNILKCII